VDDKQALVLPKASRLPLNSLVLAVRIKQSTNTTPQAQKILVELGLKQINNCALFMASADNVEKMLTISNYVAYGTPTKKTVEELLRKRGFLRSDSKRVPITDNVLIEELMGKETGCICLEDIIDALWRCSRDKDTYATVKKYLWPIQLTSLVETASKAELPHTATGRLVKKKTTTASKGGYLGYMGAEINNYVTALI
jgi:large subunit ribosomal protein L7e